MRCSSSGQAGCENAIDVGFAVTSNNLVLRLTENTRGFKIWHEIGNQNKVLLAQSNSYWDLSENSLINFNKIGLSYNKKAFIDDCSGGERRQSTAEDYCESLGMRMPSMSNVVSYQIDDCGVYTWTSNFHHSERQDSGATYNYYYTFVSGISSGGEFDIIWRQKFHVEPTRCIK